MKKNKPIHISEFLSVNKMSQMVFADRIEMVTGWRPAQPTVSCWVSGARIPSPMVRKAIEQVMGRRLSIGAGNKTKKNTK